jgi:hypothetical protein
MPPNSTPCIAVGADEPHWGGCGGGCTCGGGGCCCCRGGRTLFVEAGVLACCWASMPVILPYTCGLLGSMRRRPFQTAASSLRRSSFSSWARRQYSASGRSRAFSARAVSCDLLRFLMYSMAGRLLVLVKASDKGGLTFCENFPFA